MTNEPSQCWRAIAIGVAAWFALAIFTLLRGPDAPGSLAALNWQTENKAAQALKKAGLTWAEVDVRDGVLTLSGAAPDPKAAGLAFATARAATSAQYGFPGVYHTLATAFQTRTGDASAPLATSPTQPPPSSPAPSATPQSAAPESPTNGAAPEPDNCGEQFQAAVASQQIQFPSGSAILPREAGPVLAAITNVARRCPAYRIVIGGHTDALGDPQYNQMLSEQRAASVLNYFIEHGVSRASLSSIGYGASKPVSAERTRAANRQNRRITFDVSSPP